MMCRHMSTRTQQQKSPLMTCFLKVTVSEVEWEHKQELSSGSYSSCSGKLLDVNHEHLLQEKNGFNTVWTEQQRRRKDD